MADQSTAQAEVASTTNGNGGRKRPNKPLPTDRIAFQKQLDILRAFAIASGDERKAVRISDVAAISDFAVSTLSQANAFFVDTGLLTRTTDGFTPAEEVRAFAHNYKFTPDVAAHKLAPLVSATWFAEVLVPRLEFRDVPETEAIANLAEDVAVGPDHTEQLTTLLLYLEACNLIERIDGQIKAVVHSPVGRNAPETKDAIHPAKEETAPTPEAPRPAAPQLAAPSNAFDFSVNFHVSMDELNKWDAERISAFFSGIAQVVAAKKGLEDETSVA